jgi:hypothetical protein
MGWTFYARPAYRTVRAELDDKLTWENESGKRRVLKSSMVGSTYYAAVEHVRPDNSREVFAAIYLTKSNPRAIDGMTFGYKDMCDTMGPVESKCPAGILDLLTPTDHEYALAWRERCRNYAQRHNRRPLAGWVIALDSPLRFTDGHESSRFRVESIARRGKIMTVYRSMANNQLYRITGITERAWHQEKTQAA